MDLPAALRCRTDRLAHAWVAIFIGLWVGLMAGIAALVAVGFVIAPEGSDRLDALLQLPLWLAELVFVAAVIAGPSALLATPFLMLQRFVVGPRAPYLRPGYLAVALYGPALISLCDGQWNDPLLWPFHAGYEVVALIATLVYVRLGRAFDLFVAEPGPAPEPAGDVAARTSSAA